MPHPTVTKWSAGYTPSEDRPFRDNAVPLLASSPELSLLQSNFCRALRSIFPTRQGRVKAQRPFKNVLENVSGIFTWGRSGTEYGEFRRLTSTLWVDLGCQVLQWSFCKSLVHSCFMILVDTVLKTGSRDMQVWKTLSKIKSNQYVKTSNSHQIVKGGKCGDAGGIFSSS